MQSLIAWICSIGILTILAVGCVVRWLKEGVTLIVLTYALGSMCAAILAVEYFEYVAEHFAPNK